MSFYNFNSDLAKAKACESKVAGFLSCRGCTDIQFNDDGRYDLRYRKAGKRFTLEIKEDLMATTTGNVAIELFSRGKHSGICSSIADSWCYVIGESLYFISRAELLRNLIENGYRQVRGGDNDSSSLILIPLKSFRKICDVKKFGNVEIIP